MLTEGPLNYLPGPQGDIPVAVWRPLPDADKSIWVLHCSAFAEEMNKARHVVAEQARVLAGQGCTVVVPDLVGTGDSTLGFEAARWDIWCAEIAAVSEAAYASGAGQLVLWGLRFGCLLAVHVACGLERAPAGILLWQPVFSGRQQMGQFLRLKSASHMFGGGEQTSTSSFKADLSNGKQLEVAGYPLTPSLYADFERVTLDASVSLDIPIALIEISTRANRDLSAAAQKQLSAWKDQGRTLYSKAVGGDPFWATQELADAPELLDVGVEALTGLGLKLTESYLSLESAAAREPLDGQRSVWSATLSDGSEGAISWRCQDSVQVGVLHQPSGGALSGHKGELGVLIVVGGPQYRVGSHRQFVHLARALAAEGFPVLRFDYRGMGDSEGELLGFLSVTQDILSAVDALQRARSSVQRVVLWGLCDAATAAMNYAREDSRVLGLVLANPWVHSPEGAARVQLTRYYRDRLLSRQFWGKVLGRGMEWRRVWADFSVALQRVLARSTRSDHASRAMATPEFSEDCAKAGADPDLVAYFREAARVYQGDMLLVTSGRDYTAMEFEHAVRSDRSLRRALSRDGVRWARLDEADHTFSTAAWRKRVESLSARFARDLFEKWDSD